MRHTALFLSLAAVILLAGCDLAEEPFREQLVVNAVLIADEPFPEIRITRTFPITEPIPADGGTVRNAEVVIERLDAAGEPDQAVSYVWTSAVPDRYFPEVTEGGDRVLPLRRYRLTIRVPDDLGLVPAGQAVRGETLVPDTFRVVVPPPDTVLYRPLGDAPELIITRSSYPGRQAVFLFSIQALDPSSGLTPTYAELFDPEDFDRLIEGTSPLLNEETYEINPDGTLTLFIPWLAVAYYGPNRFIAQALDTGLFDFLRSRDAQFGGGNLSPGEIPEILTNLDNAVGVFGSVSRQTVELFVAP